MKEKYQVLTAQNEREVKLRTRQETRKDVVHGDTIQLDAHSNYKYTVHYTLSRNKNKTDVQDAGWLGFAGFRQ